MSRSFSRSKRGRKNPFMHQFSRLNVETLESRLTPSGNTISGFVYYDANSNGLFDAGETPIANSTIDLHNAADVVIASTTTNAQGYYEFTTDQTNLTQDATLTKTVSFGPTQTNFNLSGVLDQFDPSLGQLQSIEIQHAGSITSEIKVENFSSDSQSDINGTVSGTMTLTAPGVNDNLNISGYAGSFHAADYDGSTDFSGSSGTSFGQKTANGSNTITLTGSAMDAYKGTGQVNVSENAVATSNATGGGNLDVRVRSTGQSTITVIYHYKTAGPLQPGAYKVVQTQEPAGYSDGLESQNGSVIPNTIGTDFIVIGQLNGNSPNNNFGELKPTGISGHVWYDANNDGVRDPGEAAIPGTTVTLTTAAGPMQTTTDAAGFYHFDNLAPGTYTVTETQPANYLDGQDNAGTVNGVVHGTVVEDPVHDQIQTITLQSGDTSINNDFGEIKPASLAGHVYFDANNNGNFDPNELPINGATVTLTGFDDNGPVTATTAITSGNGDYKFANLRPGTYAITETQPAGYADGKDTIGTPGGTTGNDVFSDINLAAGVDGVKNDFGEIKPDTPGTPLPKNVNLLGMLPIISKSQLLNDATSDYLDPGVRGQMAFVVGTTMTLTGHQTDLNQTLTGVASLQAGTTPATFVAQVYSSTAARVQQTNTLYQTVLGRNPTAPEQASTVAQLQSGADQLTVMQDLYTSPAYQQLHPTTDALATALSKDILNVVPGSASTQSLIQSMGAEPLSTVVHDLLTSDASIGNLIDTTYLQTLRRHPTASELQLWTGPIQTGSMTLDGLTQRLLSSAEFYQLTYNTIH